MNTNNHNGLSKRIGFWSATAIVIGSVIGSGVFMKPASMAGLVGSPVLLSLAWIIAGLFSFLGAIIFAEPGAMMPETGGIYVYFKKMFGDFVAYLYGWTGFTAINTAAVAAIAFVCAQYSNHFLHLPRFSTATEQATVWTIPFIGDLFPLENFGVKLLAIVLVVVLTGLNSRSLAGGATFQLVSTAIKIGVIVALVIGIFFSGRGELLNFTTSSSRHKGSDLVSGMVAALTGAFFAYDGWINISFVAGEIKDPQRNIPKSLFAGVWACIIVYLLVNQAYLFVLPIDTMADSKLVAADAMAVAFGNTGGSIIAAMIIICTLGAINGNILATTRVTYAMARDRLFFRFSGETHPRHHTPAKALWLHAAWISVLIISGSFDMLADIMVFMSWLVYVGSSRVDLQACKLEYSIVSPK